MQDNHHAEPLVVKKFELSKPLKALSYVGILLGVLAFGVGLVKNPDRMWFAYLTAFFFVSCLGLGGLFFTALNHVANAGWSASIRRLSESMASFIPLMILGSLVLLIGLKHLYPWANPEVVAESPVIKAKVAYLNTGGLVVRLLIFGLGMALFAKKIIGNSIKQDTDGKDEHTVKNNAWSVAFTLFFALSFSLFSVDLMMSLLPSWYSTIFGVYCFSGLFQSSLAFLILMMIYVQRTGLVSGYINEEHVHDMAKYLKGFTVFWAYIAFSQFMLIWYANIPEETEFFLMRAQGGWLTISMSLLVFKFAVPFLALLPRAAKRNYNHLIAVCILVLVMQYVDVYWMVYPNLNSNEVVFGFYEIAMLLGFMGLFKLGITRFFKNTSLVAIKDPRMQEALDHHVTY